MGKSAVELIVTDLDGTIWDREGRIHPRTVAALRRLVEDGVRVLLATARRPSSVLPRMVAYDLVLPAVLFDGSLGRDFVSDETFHRSTLDPDTALWALRTLESFAIEPCINVADHAADIVAGPQPSTRPAHLVEVASVLRRGDLEAVVREEPVLSFVVCGHRRDPLLEAAAALRERVAVSVSRDITFGDFVMSVRPSGVTKWSGVLSYCAKEDLDPTKVLAVGDGENDLELLMSAFVACAVDGACDEVLTAAAHCVGPPETGGWADILDLVF